MEGNRLNIHTALNKCGEAYHLLHEVATEIEAAGNTLAEEIIPRLKEEQKERITQALRGIYDVGYFHGSRRMGKFPEDSVVCPLERIVGIIEEDKV